MARLLPILLVLFLSTIALPLGAASPPAPVQARDASGEVRLESGDVVLQTSAGSQSWAILWATKSLYTHTGVVEVLEDGKAYVIEARSTVRRTPFDEWKGRGRFHRYSVYRYQGLSEAQRARIVLAAKKYLGRRYNIYFSSHVPEVYCSQLVELAFEEAGIRLGKSQKVKDLDVDNFLVRMLVEQRWSTHPLCRDKVKDYAECWKLIEEDELISPVALTRDAKLERIWSNYPW